MLLLSLNVFYFSSGLHGVVYFPCSHAQLVLSVDSNQCDMLDKMGNCLLWARIVVVSLFL